MTSPGTKRGPIATDAFDKIEVGCVEELDAWLEENHGRDDSVWLITHKKHVTGRYIAMPQVLDALMRHGWVDGIRRKLDADRSMQLIGKRRQQVWAKTYKDRVARLTQEGLMRPWGLAAVERAQQECTWNAMADVDALVVPDDLRAALDLTRSAAPMLDACPPSYRRNVLRWLASARTPETRTKRIAAITDACASGQRLPQM